MKPSENDIDPRLVPTDESGPGYPEVTGVEFSADSMTWRLGDGLAVTVPLSHWPTLWLATDEERLRMEIAGAFVHWPLLDADISSANVLCGDREHRHFARLAWERWMARRYGAAKEAHV
jgi:hypothetical protein